MHLLTRPSSISEFSTSVCSTAVQNKPTRLSSNSSKTYSKVNSPPSYPIFCFSPLLANGSLSAFRKTLSTLSCRGRMKAKSTQSVREIVTVWFIFLDMCNVSDCRRCVCAHVCVLSVWCVCLSGVSFYILVWKWKESLSIAVFNFNHYRDVPIWLSFLLPGHLRCT